VWVMTGLMHCSKSAALGVVSQKRYLLQPGKTHLRMLLKWLRSPIITRKGANS